MILIKFAGTHPAEVNTEVQRSVCKGGFSSCCERQVTIKIRNCGQFMAYCLPALDSCPERYCFGKFVELNFQYCLVRLIFSLIIVRCTRICLFCKNGFLLIMIYLSCF